MKNKNKENSRLKMRIAGTEFQGITQKLFRFGNLSICFLVSVLVFTFASSSSWAVYGVPIINLKHSERLERAGKYLQAAASRELAADFYEFVSIPQFEDDMEYFMKIGEEDRAAFCRNTISGFQKSMKLCRNMAEKDIQKVKLTKEQIDKYRDRNRIRMLAGAEVYPVMHNGQMGVDVGALEKNGVTSEDFERAAEGRERTARLYEKITIPWALRESEILAKAGRTKLAKDYEDKIKDYRQKVKNHYKKANENRQKAEELRKFDDAEYVMKALDDNDPSIRELAVKKLIRDINYPGVLKAAKSTFADVSKMGKDALEENKRLFEAVKLDALVLALDSDGPDIRKIAIDQLEAMTGTTFGYLPDAGDASRQAALAQWQKWLKGKLKSGLSGIYYKGKDFDKEIITRIDRELNFVWNNKPDESLPEDKFSVRWVGKISIPKTGKYSISVEADDGAKIWLGKGPDLKQIISYWSEYSYAANKKEMELEAGLYDIRIEYFENSKKANMMLFWSSEDFKKQIIPEKNLFYVSLAQ